MTNQKKLTILAVTVLLVPALFISGCTGELSAEEIVEQMQEKEASIQDYSYTMQITSYFGNQTKEIEIQTLQKKPDKTKTVTIKPEEEAGSIAVVDGEFMWVYDLKTNKVIKMEMPDTPILGEIDYAGIISEFLNKRDVSLLGMEEIDGRPTYLLETKPREKEEGLLIGRMKFWVDKETWMFLRYEMYDSSGDLSIKFEIRDLKIDQGIPDSEFVFEVPEGATVKTVNFDSLIPKEMTLEEARESAGFEILIPEYLPEEYAFNYSTVSNNSWIAPEGQASETVSLTYENEEGDYIFLSETVHENEAQEAPIMNSAEDMIINGMEGKYLDLGDMKILTWKIRNVDLSLTASLEKDELLKIAESIRENI
ncbi:MAG: outer membrane lipoprotein-sorting protein [Methanosarcina sp.]|nr:outer membrane lipoprotein-sorting protein [Methanosarcina sp.]MDD4306797.1 outer membrane lipoprotein-sorting protein [Methanosarcina sp.]MDD4619776.1 outer membrane lipoprotein-sorting protein [Methanosarcina sp.]